MTVLEFNLEPRIERELEKLELIHQEWDQLFLEMEEVVEKAMSPKLAWEHTQPQFFGFGLQNGLQIAWRKQPLTVDYS